MNVPNHFQTWLAALLLGMALVLLGGAQGLHTVARADGEPTTAGRFDAISAEMRVDDKPNVYPAGAPSFGALVYDPDFKLVEKQARKKLKQGLDVREAFSPYAGNKSFEEYVKTFDYEAGWTQPYTGTTPYTETLTLIALIDQADNDLREARDLYAYLLVHAPEYRFRADSYYVTDTHVLDGFTAPLCGKTDKEDPDPEDTAHSGLVLDPVIDWCNFQARLRQSVREAAHLRLIFGQQFMVDAFGLHFSGIEFVGGDNAVRTEVAQLRAAKHQYEMAEQGLAESLDRAVGNGCYVSDFYKQAEWSLLSRAIEGQETVQHHIGVRLSYLDIEPEPDADSVAAVDSVAWDAFRQASMEGHIKVIGMASLSAAPTVGAGCAQGERPDGRLAATMAANLVETRRKAHEMKDGRNVFGFDVTFTPARFYKSSEAMGCDTNTSGLRGLWDEAWCAAEYAKELQNDEVANTRAFEDSQTDLRAEIKVIEGEIDARITAVSGCTPGDDTAFFACVDQQVANLNTCMRVVTVAVKYDNQNALIPSAFDQCMAGTGGYPTIHNGEAKQALYDLRSIYVDYLAAEKKAINIDERIQNSDDRNSTVVTWLAASGGAETAARVSASVREMQSCMKPEVVGTSNTAGQAAAMSVSCGVLGTIDTILQGAAGALSTAANCEIEKAQNEEETQNLVLDQTELLIDAYGLNQQWFAKKSQFEALLGGLQGDVDEAMRQRDYFENSPANDPSFRIVRDSARLVLAKQMEYAARIAYLAARRAEYEYAARLSASNFRISDIYRARTADDIMRYLQQMRNRSDNIAGGTSAPEVRDVKISLAQHVLLWTDQALTAMIPYSNALEGNTDQWPDRAECQGHIENVDILRACLFRQWAAQHSHDTDNDGIDDVLEFDFPALVQDGHLLSRLLRPAYDNKWLLKLTGLDNPVAGSNGVSVNLVTDQQGLSYQEVILTQGGQAHLRSFAGCTFDYKLMAPAVLLGLEWPKSQSPDVATASFLANVNGTHTYSENNFRTARFHGRPVSSEWMVEVKAEAPGNLPTVPDMDLQELTDIELLFSISYASRQPEEPELSECTRIDW